MKHPHTILVLLLADPLMACSGNSPSGTATVGGGNGSQGGATITGLGGAPNTPTGGANNGYGGAEVETRVSPRETKPQEDRVQW